jgi:hypothetical protein
MASSAFEEEELRLIGCLEFGTKGALLLRLKTLTTWKENQFG